MAYEGRADNETLRDLKRSGDDETTKEQHTDWRAKKQRAQVRDKGTRGREEELTLKGRNDDHVSRPEDHQLTGKPRNDQHDERTTEQQKRGRKNKRTKEQNDDLRNADSLLTEHDTVASMTSNTSPTTHPIS
jgi:hypothetical protein